MVTDVEMQAWREVLTAQIESADTVEKAGAACRRLAHVLGFPHFLLGLRLALSLDGPAQLILSGYPREWRLRYDERGYMAIDPVLARALLGVRPFAWDELERSSPGVAAFFADAAAHGLGHGFTVPVRGVRGSLSLLSLARPEPLPADAECRDRLYRHAHWLALHLHERLCALIGRNGEPALQRHRLSARERECLSPAAQGYSARALGRKLGISERTAIFHLNHAVKKLGARSRQHAIALAASLGLLEVSAYPQRLDQPLRLFEIQ